ncbi:MAG: DUF3179 domain-containing protein [Thermaerobacterales bacterium]
MKKTIILSLILIVGLLAAACGAADQPAPDAAPAPSSPAPAASTESSGGNGQAPESDFVHPNPDGPDPDPLVDVSEIISGGPPPDGIPPVDQPRFVSVDDADDWIGDREPVLFFSIGDDVRVYPIQIMIWHEIVNDVVGGRPVSVTFCPLCYTAVAMDRQTDHGVLDFGTSGKLYRSALVMYDRQSDSYWLHFTGLAVKGALTGTQLDLLPVNIISWADAKERHPEAKVLSRQTGFSRNYGSNPYFGYDDIDQRPFLFRGEIDERLKPMARVVGVDIDGVTRAYPLSFLADEAEAGNGRSVIQDRLGGSEVVIFFSFGTTSAVDQSSIADSRDIGATGIFTPHAAGQDLTFEAVDEGFRDQETGTLWNLFGEAVEGDLVGERLEPLLHLDTFWFAWAAYHGETDMWDPAGG